MSFLFNPCSPCCSGDVPLETVDTACCSGVPVTLYASFSGGIGTCNSLDGTVVTLTYTSSMPAFPGVAGWIGSFGLTTISFYCDVGQQKWLITTNIGSACTFISTYILGTSCDPFLVFFDNLNVTVCCVGTSDITVTGVSP